MSGLFGTQLALRSEGLSVAQQHNEALRSCQVVIGFGMPYETLLGAICHSVHNAKAIGQFFGRLSAIDEQAVHAYLGHFVKRLISEFDFSSSELEVKPEFKNTPMDFPRPSPTLHFLLPAFFIEITSVCALRDVGTSLPICLASPRSEQRHP